jgi:hypothetical protein
MVKDLLGPTFLAIAQSQAQATAALVAGFSCASFFHPERSLHPERFSFI